jgi:hypothetical protein
MEKQLIRKPLGFFGSGTNVGRVAKAANRADVYITVPYALKERVDDSTIQRRLACLSLSGVSELPAYNDENGFSWVKVFRDVKKASAPLKAVFQGLYGCSEDNQSFQLSALESDGEQVDNEFTCVMHWCSARKRPLAQLKALVQEWVPNSVVVLLTGDETCNREAEAEVKAVVAQAKLAHKRVIILSNTMGSRSFSIPEVEACVFMFDRGDIGLTEQRAARCLTPGSKLNGEPKKFGWIVNLSIDSNRTETLDEMILVEAKRVADTEGKDFVAALKAVLLTMNIFSEKYGVGRGLYQESDIDLAVRQLRGSDKLLKVANATVDLTKISLEDLMDRLINVPEAERQGALFDSLLPAVQTAVTLEPGTPVDRAQSDELKATLRDLQKRVERLNQSALDVAALSDYSADTYRECLLSLENEAKASFELTYGVDPYTVINLLDLGVLPEVILDLIIHSEENYAVDDFWA